MFSNRSVQIAGILLVAASGFMFFSEGDEVDSGASVGEVSQNNGSITLRLVSGLNESEGLDCGASLWMVTGDGARSLTADPNRVCADGHLLWEGLSSGSYRVMTRASGFLDGDFEATVDGGPVDLGSQPMDMAASIEGTVTADDVLVADARVLLSDGQATSTLGDGSFSFRNVPVGEIELRAASVGVRAQQVFDLPSEGLSGISVELIAASERGLLGLRCELAECGCEISDLLPGSPAGETLEVGDCFSEVNGESIIGVPRNVIGSKLAGEVGEVIALTFADELIELTLGSPVSFRPSR